MTIRTTHNGEVRIAYEPLGPDDGEPLLLISGMGGQMLDWRDGFCEMLGDRGFAVTRFDNRDSGLSTRLDTAGRPNQLTMLLRPAAAAVYRLGDMAADALAVMDALDWPSAHVAGVSLGAMIAQTLAARHPARVRSLTSISSTPDPRIGRATMRTVLRIARIAQPRRVKSVDGFVRYAIALTDLAGSPDYPVDEAELRAHAARCYERGGMDLAAVQRQTAAVAADGDRTAELATVTTPTVVIHGASDLLIRPVGGIATARAIPGARLVTYPGMGHGLPVQLWPAITDEIADLAGLGRHLTPAPDQV
jgi:pimeloyl-ACP methyl ester carboxylesterase